MSAPYNLLFSDMALAAGVGYSSAGREEVTHKLRWLLLLPEAFPLGQRSAEDGRVCCGHAQCRHAVLDHQSVWSAALQKNQGRRLEFIT